MERSRQVTALFHHNRIFAVADQDVDLRVDRADDRGADKYCLKLTVSRSIAERRVRLHTANRAIDLPSVSISLH
jgi:hypothetical protein